MKKIIALLLFALVFTMCACEKKDEDIRGEYKNQTENVSVDLSDEIESSDEEFSLGKIAANVYESDFIGIGYKLDENWSFYDDERIKELNNITIDIAGEEYEKLIKNANVVFDMFATDSDNLNNINIILEKVSTIQLASLNIEENFNIIASEVKDGLENMGYENITFEIGSVEVDGKTLDALHNTAEFYGIKMYQTQFAVKCNGYLANITVSTAFENTIPQLIDNFYWLEQ